MRTIREHWDDYNKVCLPSDMSADQRNETRAAFYTGAQVVLSILYSMPPPDWSNEARVAVIDGLQDEIYELVGRKVHHDNAGHA